MWWSPAPLAALLVVSCAAAKHPAAGSGISQFWTDDYKVFDQVYGRTSDKEIFGATLPPSVAYGIDARLRNQASEKKERYYEQQQNPYLGEEDDPYGFGARYPSLTNQALTAGFNKVTKQKFPSKFIPSDFTTVINKDNDPETYEYLKNLELLQRKKEKLNVRNIGGYSSYQSYATGPQEEPEGYRSIQDILDAHDANKGNDSEEDEAEDPVKYLKHGGSKKRVPVKKVKSPPPLKVKPGKPRCPSGRCRKRATTSYRGRTYLTRPMIRKIKKVIYH